MNFEIIILILILGISLLLVFKNFNLAFFVLLFLSILLHKELFSIYRWDLLPVRIMMVSIAIYALYGAGKWFVKSRNYKDLKTFVTEPFVLLLLSLWFVRGLSLGFSKNLQASLFLFGFFTTIVLLGLLLYNRFSKSPEVVFKYIKAYIFMIFGLCLFAYFQLYLYMRYEIIIGALWNVPGHTARVGSLFWDVNHFGGLLAATLPVVGVLILVSNTLKEKFMWGLMLVPMTGVLLLTNSRTSWLLAGFSFLFFITTLLIRKFGLKGIFYILFALTLIATPMLIEYSQKDSPFRARIKQYFHYRIDSFDSHILLLEGALEVFEKYPVLGGGYGSFFEQFSKTQTAAEFFGRDPAGLNVRVPAHTIWGEALAETGLIGFYLTGLLFLFLLSFTFYGALTLKDKKDYLMLAAMSAAIFGWFFGGGIFYSYNSEFFWLSLFLYFIYSVGVLKENYNFSKMINYFSKFHISIILVVVCAFILIFIGLGSTHLIPWDEAIYAKISKNMLLKESYLIPSWNGVDAWLEKPPFYMWATSFFMKIIGVSSFAVRLPSATFGFLTVVLTYLFSKKLFGKSVGFLSALVLLTTFHFLYYSRIGMLDVTLTFFITLSMYLYWEAKDSKKALLWVLSGMSIGMAVLTKGVVGLLPFVIIGIYELLMLLLAQKKMTIKLLAKYMALVISALVVFMPWHIFMHFEFGNTFYNTYIGYHVLERASHSIEDKGRPIFWYLEVLRVSMRTWYIVLFAAYPFAIIIATLKKSKAHLFLIVWSLCIFVFFSVAKSKLVWYIMPVYPVLAIIIGYFVSKVIDFLASYISKKDYLLLKGIAIYSVFIFSVGYLFIERKLVYTGDLTGSQAQLLELKDEVFGKETKVYADRIELPLTLYYTDGPVEIVDFGPLTRKLQSELGYEEKVVFITKESRLRTLKADYDQPDLELEEQINEWVLGYKPSKKEKDIELYKETRREVESIENDIEKKTRDNAFIPQGTYLRLKAYTEKLELLKIQIGELPEDN